MVPTRGIRNNNPSNLRITTDKWEGLCGRQNDVEFFQFESMAYGLRALIKTLRTYKRKGFDTVEKIIRRWAPDSENPTENYIKFVCEYTDFYPDAPLSDLDLTAVAHAIVAFENGLEQAETYIKPEDWDQALAMLDK